MCRLEGLETAQKRVEIPDIVFISPNADSTWTALEKYSRKNKNGDVIRGSGMEKRVIINSPEEYKEKAGFSGVVIIENLDE